MIYKLKKNEYFEEYSPCSYVGDMLMRTVMLCNEDEDETELEVGDTIIDNNDTYWSVTYKGCDGLPYSTYYNILKNY